MTKQQDADEQNLIREIVDVQDEIHVRKQREEERHVRKMDEIEDAKEEMLERLYAQAGLDIIGNQHSTLLNLRGEIVDTRKAVKDRFAGVISHYLDGGYDKRITVKKGWVYKYGRQNRANYSFRALAKDKAHKSLIEAFEQDAPDGVAGAVEHAFATVGRFTDSYGVPTFSASMEVEPFTIPDKRNRHELEIDEVEVKVHSRSGYGDRITIYLRDTDMGLHGGKSVSTHPTSRQPDEMKRLIRVRDEVLALMDDIQMDMEDALTGWQKAEHRINEDLSDVSDD